MALTGQSPGTRLARRARRAKVQGPGMLWKGGEATGGRRVRRGFRQELAPVDGVGVDVVEINEISPRRVAAKEVKFFAYMILHRIQPCLDSHQPQEQHGFRAGRRLEEHLLTANLFLDKKYVSILCFDLSKAFDRVDWSALCLALSEHGVSSHMVWVLHRYCFVNLVRSLEKEGTAVPFKSTQACEKDACLVRKCCPQCFIRQCQHGEDGRKDVRLDLILVMACHHF